MKRILTAAYALSCISISIVATAQPSPQHNLKIDSLSKQWDEGIPLGNALIGALVWQKDNQLRMALDRADLWDQRPMKGLHREEFSYDWVFQKVIQGDYAPVQQYFDHPYDREPAPSKIPGAALEFDITQLGNKAKVELNISNAECTIAWPSGTRMRTLVHATAPVGIFRFDNVPENFIPQLIAPRYQGEVVNTGNPVGGDDLARLGYPQGSIQSQPNSLLYEQEGWGGFRYKVYVKWKKAGKTGIEGVWTIESTNGTEQPGAPIKSADSLLQLGYQRAAQAHTNWWKQFWSASSIRIPDTVIEKQYYLEQYKFGSAARATAPPISLQAVWTADNGRIPPWKGDYHHDLNTQLSYWPSYTANHLSEAMGYLNHLDQNKANYMRYTKRYFGKDGLAVPGVTTLDGTEMGGWIQYSLSPTVSSWLTQHYYLQWRYSMDTSFLKNRAYPWAREVARFIEQITFLNREQERQLPISSSPEINDNRLSAWFRQLTNYDLALLKFALQKAAEMANELQLPNEAARWQSLEQQLPSFALSKTTSLQFSRTLPYNESHRHFSHLMAIHPLGLIQVDDGVDAQRTIQNTIHELDSIGAAAWCGYSYSWLANLKAWARDGEGAARALTIFATAFTSTNSFHLNGDQTGKGYSGFTYRPVTLEGNFAFAAGVQEMLLQSQAGYIDIMPAVPRAWQNAAFNQLRTQGAFLVDAKRVDGKLKWVRIYAEAGGNTNVRLGEGNWVISKSKDVSIDFEKGGMATLRSNKGGWIELITK